MESKTSDIRIKLPLDVKNGIEYRYDPLVGSVTRTNPSRATRPMSTSHSPSALGALEKVIEESKDNDPFGPYEKLDKTVTKLTDEFVAQVQVEEQSGVSIVNNRLHCGETVLFPNKFPFGTNHAVTVMSDAHYVAMNAFTKKQVEDAIKTSLVFIRTALRMSESEGQQRMWPTLVWNYMPPSAGSIIHPHFQVFLEDTPHPSVGHALLCAQNWIKSPNAHAAAISDAIMSREGLVSAAAAGQLPSKNGELQVSCDKPSKDKRSYFTSLISQEKQDEVRYIGEFERIYAVAPYAARGLNEVHLIIPGFASLDELTPEVVSQLSHCFVAVLQAYHEAGIGSFNMASVSASTSSSESEKEAFALHFKFISRPFPSGVYTNDCGPIERLYDTFIINTFPEAYTPCFKQVWTRYFESLSKSDNK